MDDISLEVFRAVATELSITRAAQRLGRVPSNVTTRIQQLEAELGVELFVRDGKRITLSAQGERFLGYAEQLMALTEEARQSMHADAPSGVFKIGTMESTAASRLPAPLAEFHRRWPAVHLEVSTAPSAQLIDRVSSHAIDGAFVAWPSLDETSITTGLHEARLEGIEVYREDMHLVLPQGHTQVKGPGDIHATTLATFAMGCSYRSFAEQWLAEAGRRMDVQVVGSYHAMLACVAAGSSICVMPKSVLDLSPNPAVKTQSIGRLTTRLIWRAGYLTPALTALRDVLTGSNTIDSSVP